MFVYLFVREEASVVMWANRIQGQEKKRQVLKQSRGERQSTTFRGVKREHIFQ
jgi:hypothetical protein